MGGQFHTLKVSDVRRETPQCVSVAFEVPVELKNEFAFLPGQNVTIRHVTVGGEELRRTYSICSVAADKELRIAVKAVEKGQFSSWVNGFLKAGDMLDVMAPVGNFVLRNNMNIGSSGDTKNENSNGSFGHYLGIAAGSGITPLFSIMRHVLQTERESSFTLIFGNRDIPSIIFRDQLLALKNKYPGRFAVHFLLSRDESAEGIYNGRITTHKLDQMSGKLIDFHSMNQVFLCGPGKMVFELKDWLIAKGVDAQKIHFELFTVPVETLNEEETSPVKKVAADASKPIADSVPAVQASSSISKITIKIDGRSSDFELAYDSDTILTAGMNAGLDLPFSCKGGVCSTCRAKILEGEVEMETNYALEPEEIQEGYILVCQSRPLTSKVSISYD